ncbi:hypothetical protein ACK8P5_25715 (plasmid) [Paenibacillus sp. EC2-1]|uniref:hypothetical protein n=1 Tax=Paenibacillus sp. EC2-1 TaxID=3388665 RepID=UPI003BEEF621
MNKILKMLRGGMQSHLIVADMRGIVIPAKTTVDIDMTTGYNKILLKSIEVSCRKNQDLRVEFFEERLRENSRYNSGNVTQEAYDVLDLPFVDQDGQQQMYLRITNLGSVEAEFDVEIRGLELK